MKDFSKLSMSRLLHLISNNTEMSIKYGTEGNETEIQELFLWVISIDDYEKQLRLFKAARNMMITRLRAEPSSRYPSYLESQYLRVEEYLKRINIQSKSI